MSVGAMDCVRYFLCSFTPVSRPQSNGKRSVIAGIDARAVGVHKLRRKRNSEQAMISYGHFVGGKAVAGKSGRTSEVFQPLDGTVRASVALASTEEVRAAV